MPRYVDAENELKELCEICEYQKQCENLPKEKRCVEYNIIANAPTADVAPVRHSYWRQTEGNWFECAGKDGCGYYTDSEHCGSYCPECGAKMDEEVE